MIVEGAVVMVENIVRLLSHPRRQSGRDGRAEDHRAAAHEVQRPVFYSIAIIITAYVPIFTLQRVEGRLFRPMAWTVAFALLGALLFSMFLAPVLASIVFPRGTKEWRNPLMTVSLTRYTARRWTGASGRRWVTVGAALAASCRDRIIWPSAASSARSSCRTWMKARSGRAARWLPAPARPKARAS